MQEQIKLQLTNHYHLEFEQISRILQYAAAQGTRKKIPREEFLDALGMVKRQFENLSSLCVALGLTKKQTFVLTPLGKTVAQYDLFFDQLETLWVLHYVISGEPKWVVWNRVINRVVPENEMFTREAASSYYSDLKPPRFSPNSYEKKLPDEISVVLNAYTEQKFTRLRIIEKSSTGEYVRGEPVTIQPLPFLYTLLQFRDRFFPNATGLVIADIIQAENSPGKVYFLAEYTVRDLLSTLHDMNLLRIETFGDLEQIRFADGVTKEHVLMRIYRNTHP